MLLCVVADVVVAAAAAVVVVVVVVVAVAVVVVVVPIVCGLRVHGLLLELLDGKLLLLQRLLEL